MGGFWNACVDDQNYETLVYFLNLAMCRQLSHQPFCHRPNSSLHVPVSPLYRPSPNLTMRIMKSTKLRELTTKIRDSKITKYKDEVLPICRLSLLCQIVRCKI